MKEIEIEKGVPIARKGLGHSTVYPWSKLEKGDSFIVEKSKANSARTSLGNAYQKGTLDRKVKIVSRTVEDGVRFWRQK